ncbi:MAG TPA: PAS domain S-box protein [Thermoanaerobaculia bacterium]
MASITSAAAQYAPVPLIGLDREGKVLFWNAAAARFFGWASPEVLGQRDPTVPKEETRTARAILEAVFRGQARSIDTRRCDRDGALIDVLWTVTPLFGREDEVIAAVCTYEDLAPVRAAEHVLTAAERRSRFLLESVVDLGVMVLSPDGRILESNYAARALLGWGDESWSGMDVAEVWHPEPRDAATLLGVAGRRGRLTTETRCLRADGSVFWADVVLTAVKTADGEVADYILVLRDVTEQRDARAKLDRRAAQNAAVAAYAQRAMAEQNIDELARAALEHLSAAAEADYAELLEPADAETLTVRGRFSWREAEPAETRVPATGITLAAEAFARQAAVARPLIEADFEAAPHLRQLGVRSGAATAVAADGQVTIFTIYSRERLLDESELYPLQAIAALFAGAKARRLAEQQLAESETTLRLMFEQVPAMIWAVDRDLTFLSGHHDPPIGRSLVAAFGENSLPVRTTRAALRGESGSYFFQLDGRAFDSRVEPLRDATGAVVGAVTLSFDVTERTRVEDALRTSREELRRLSAQFNQMQEEERRRIAREVHDELGQRLTALRLEVGLLRTAGNELEPRLAGMLSLIDETIDTVRRVATALRPAVLDDFGFRAAIENELAMLRKRTDIETTFSFKPEDYRLEANRATALFRIVQEVLTNVARHARATRVDVRFDAHNGWIYLDIRDNGRGITQEEIAHSRSLGLVGVRERAYAFGGDALITGEAGQGTHVAIRLPEEDA